MKIQYDPRTQIWIYLNKDISKWIHQGEQIILMGTGIVKPWRETHVWKQRDLPKKYTIYTGIQMLQ